MLSTLQERLEMKNWDEIEEYYDVRGTILDAYVKTEDDYILVHEEEMPFYASTPGATPFMTKQPSARFGFRHFWLFLGRTGHHKAGRKSHGFVWKAKKEDIDNLENGNMLHPRPFTRPKTVVQHNPLQSLSAFFVFITITFLLRFVYLKSLDVVTMGAEMITGVHAQDFGCFTHGVVWTYATLSVFATWYAVFLVVREVVLDWIMGASSE
ncbi:hypothetical protein YB2330_005690 [Saitoella coloradoensis]